ncbi:MAG: DUF1036 domain-containing protein [Rhodobiaceae bacterium]|nr:DUF1036 domain-containing protein [Rhodobiaceae bacterium]MCC0015488.1 DUF1036 domain-containing protein [Rhodobiaceae bacterium]MCC0040946.1 DUF1036 domain-containing protein [Rhodobiaceae bacterium]MCC0053273.1 DUF1036 domain-containing protein [Rhodobiaceae bacterium]
MGALVAGGLALAGGPAQADLRMCNSTPSRVGVAIGYNNGKEWISEGWWNVEANSCEILLEGPLVARFYYFYAIDYDQGGEWSGSDYMCTADKVFLIREINRCEERGYHRNGFMEVDTGENTSWTVRLTEPTRQTGSGG